MPFTPMRLDEDKLLDKREIVSVSLNEEERAWLDGIKEDTGIKMDSTALKICAKIGANVIQTLSITKIVKQSLRRKD